MGITLRQRTGPVTLTERPCSLTSGYSLRRVSGVDLATPSGEHHGGTADQEQSAECSNADHGSSGGWQPILVVAPALVLTPRTWIVVMGVRPDLSPAAVSVWGPVRLGPKTMSAQNQPLATTEG